jgi:hypothetical protein
MNPDSSDRLDYEVLENEVAQLRARVRSIEDALHRRGVVLETLAPEFASRTQQTVEQPSSPVQPPTSADAVRVPDLAPVYRAEENTSPYAIPGPAPLFAASHAPASRDERTGSTASASWRCWWPPPGS